MVTTYIIDKFEDIIEIGTTFGKNWYRGHNKIIGDLTPSVFRSRYTNPIYLGLHPQPEFRLAEDFKRIAPSISKDLPDYNSHLEWLFLMQHHGVPTRLLDWSENILVATFFAVTTEYDQDAELWSLFPWKLNENHGFYGLPTPNNKTLLFLAHEIFHNNPTKLAQEYNLENIPKVPMALLPPLSHPRISVQQSGFTIHPIPTDGCSISDIITDEQFLVRYIIPKKIKKEIELKLMYLGITYRNIFPDLEGLAKTLKQAETFIGWGQPKPLKLKRYE